MFDPYPRILAGNGEIWQNGYGNVENHGQHPREKRKRFKKGGAVSELQLPDLCKVYLRPTVLGISTEIQSLRCTVPPLRAP